MKNLYPLKFKPILKEKIWGGQKLKTILNKNAEGFNIGESWEISDVEGETSIVDNGYLKGSSLTEILNDRKEKLVGQKNFERFGSKFPLLIKFIDAKETLSIQLHPNDELAALRHNSFGKTEMWYVMQADENGELIIGFNDIISPSKYLDHLKSKTLTEILNFEAVKAGDTFFIEVGRVHAIGAGVMLAEIQQTSDITYRLYDWDRKDSHGNERELHNDLALEAIDFTFNDDFKVNYKSEVNTVNKMVECPYFTTNYLQINRELKLTNEKDSFIIYMCVEGSIIISSQTFSESLNLGETVLIPACIKNYTIKTNGAKLLEVFI